MEESFTLYVLLRVGAKSLNVEEPTKILSPNHSLGA